MQRRSVAIAVIAAAIALFAGAYGLLRFGQTGERMSALAPVAPRSKIDTPLVATAVAPESARPSRGDMAAAPEPAAPSPSRVDEVPAAASSPEPAVAARPPAEPGREAQVVEAPRPAPTTVPPVAAPAATPATKPSEPAVTPSFDIVRVEPNGDTLVAGRAAPNSTVSLVDRNKTVAEARTDATGNFVLTPPALPSGDHALGLREGQGGSAHDSTQSVVVSVPRARSQQVVVALAEPNQPTRLLSAPPAPSPAPVPVPVPAEAPTAVPTQARVAVPSQLAIRSVELENGSGLFASGVAPPGTDVRLYLNDSRVADVIAAAAGAWTVTVRKGLTAGRYAVRADSLKPDHSVAARVEVPFDVPSAMAAAPDKATSSAPDAANAPPTAASNPETGRTPTLPAASATTSEPAPPSSTSAGNAVVDELQTELVARGDNLWRISRKRLGLGTRYTQIYAANAAQIRDPRLIYPGQVFVMPR